MLRQCSLLSSVKALTRGAGEGLGHDSIVKSTCWFYRGPKHLGWGSQPPVVPSPGG